MHILAGYFSALTACLILACRVRSYVLANFLLLIWTFLVQTDLLDLFKNVMLLVFAFYRS